MRIIFLLTALTLSAQDWPEWRGKGRLHPAGRRRDTR